MDASPRQARRYSTCIAAFLPDGRQGSDKAQNFVLRFAPRSAAIKTARFGALFLFEILRKAQNDWIPKQVRDDRIRDCRVRPRRTRNDSHYCNSTTAPAAPQQSKTRYGTLIPIFTEAQQSLLRLQASA